MRSELNGEKCQAASQDDVAIPDWCPYLDNIPDGPSTGYGDRIIELHKVKEGVAKLAKYLLEKVQI